MEEAKGTGAARFRDALGARSRKLTQDSTARSIRIPRGTPADAFHGGSAGFPTNFGAQPLIDVGRSLSLRNSPQKHFPSETPGRQLVGSFFELGRLFRKPLFKGVPVSNTLALLNHLDGRFEP